jgi:PhnB protein
MTEPVKPIPDGYATVTPYLVVEHGDAVLDFMQRAFGASLIARTDTPDGRLMHAEVQIGDSKVMLGEAGPEWPALKCMLHLFVEDVDAAFRQAVQAGGQSIREPETMFYGDRSGGVADPAGNMWWISTHVEDVSPEEMERRQAEYAARSAAAG